MQIMTMMPLPPSCYSTCSACMEEGMEHLFPSRRRYLARYPMLFLHLARARTVRTAQLLMMH
jgi:hypothetical protein